jgi:hypothetical protein
VIFRDWMNSCLCTLPDRSAMLFEIDRTRSTQLFRVPINTTAIEAFGNSIEFYWLDPPPCSKFRGLQKPVWTGRSHAAPIFPSGSFAFGVIFRTLRQNRLLRLSHRRYTYPVALHRFPLTSLLLASLASAPLRSPALFARLRRGDWSSRYADE